MNHFSFFEEKNGQLWLTEDERDNLKVSYRIKDVIYSEKSDFQHVMIVDSYEFGRMLILDGVVQTTALDGHIYNEMIAHVPLSIHPNPKRVLIIGGGDCGVAKEVTKYKNVEEIDMVEIDELVVKASKEHLQEVSGNLSDPRVNFIFTDGIEFVASKKGEYDVIIIDSSDPVGPAEQLFSYSFYADIQTALKEDGLMVCQSQSPMFHQEIFKQTNEHLKKIFPIVAPYIAVVPTYPGGFWSFTLASKKYQHGDGFVQSFDTRYFNEAVYQGSFKLPVFIEALVHK